MTPSIAVNINRTMWPNVDYSQATVSKINWHIKTRTCELMRIAKNLETYKVLKLQFLSEEESLRMLK